MSPTVMHSLDTIRKRMHKMGTDHAEAMIRHHLHVDKESSNEIEYTNPRGTLHRFRSFADVNGDNEVKWHVDGSSYMYAVSTALEAAEQSIWILDWWLSPELYLRRPPLKYEDYRLDRMLLAAAMRGVSINIIVYKEIPSTLTVSSSHTKHTLEDLHPNIRILRHPDHTFGLRNRHEVSLHDLHLGNSVSSNFAEHPPYGQDTYIGNSIWYWAHHEKLCLIDGDVAFMGGLDLSFGRWDTNQHPIADAHPTSEEAVVFPGQDYNNARLMDFANVTQWTENKLDRNKSPRMGWSDVSVSLVGPCVQDLQRHFMERWNFIFDRKYRSRNKRYKELSPTTPMPVARWGTQMSCQIVRSCSKWSNGSGTERSIQNAYIDVIENSQHFVYIENQFFITATGDAQKPVTNQIGKALVDRILRAARAGERYKVVVMLPSVPAFAGDLNDDASLSARIVLNFQYNSICSGGNSIMERIAVEGFDPKEYIRFYNLRNYDRINAENTVSPARWGSSVHHRGARQVQNDDFVIPTSRSWSQHSLARSSQTKPSEKQHQDTENQVPYSGTESMRSTRWDSVSECYMLDGADIREVPWDLPSQPSEINAFVTEQLYIHSKVLIADDRCVICGSANLNDRSQLGYHDSEIAIVVQDSTQVASKMAGRPWQANAFAASLRRHLYRKHLGLLSPRKSHEPDINSEPVRVRSDYDWDCTEDEFVSDPLSVDLLQCWDSQAKQNTDVFRRVFRVVPDDTVRTWRDYERFTHCFSHGSSEERIAPGHVVRGDFSPGASGVNQVKDLLSQIRGTLVEMPLNFLLDEDVAKSGIALNALTEWIYT